MQPEENNNSSNSWSPNDASPTQSTSTATVGSEVNETSVKNNLFQSSSQGTIQPMFAPAEPEVPKFSNKLDMQSGNNSDAPVPVVKVLSVRGVEYMFMSIFLWIGAASFIGMVLSLINGQSGFSTLAFPLSVLIVALPGFALLFLRLKKAELADPNLKFDASKRRLTQITQILAFLTCLINLITYIYIVMQKIGGEGNVSIGKVSINVLVIMIVAGGILAYYWHDEHKGRK